MLMPRWKMIIISKTNEIIVFCSKKLRGTFTQCLPPVKKRSVSCPLHADVWLPIVALTHPTSMKRLRVTYNNTYRIMHYIPRNVSVCSEKISHYVRTFDALFGEKCKHKFFCFKFQYRKGIPTIFC